MTHDDIKQRVNQRMLDAGYSKEDIEIAELATTLSSMIIARTDDKETAMQLLACIVGYTCLHLGDNEQTKADKVSDDVWSNADYLMNIFLNNKIKVEL